MITEFQKKMFNFRIPNNALLQISHMTDKTTLHQISDKYFGLPRESQINLSYLLEGHYGDPIMDRRMYMANLHIEKDDWGVYIDDSISNFMYKSNNILDASCSMTLMDLFERDNQ